MTDQIERAKEAASRRSRVYCDTATICLGLGNDAEIEITQHTAEVIPFKRREAQPKRE